MNCHTCGKTIDSEIINDVHVDGLDDDDVVCTDCTNALLLELLDDIHEEEYA